MEILLITCDLIGRALVILGIGFAILTAAHQHKIEYRRINVHESGDAVMAKTLSNAEALFPRLFSSIDPIRMRNYWISAIAALIGNVMIFGTRLVTVFL